MLRARCYRLALLVRDVGDVRLGACMHGLATADKPADAARERRCF